MSRAVKNPYNHPEHNLCSYTIMGDRPITLFTDYQSAYKHSTLVSGKKVALEGGLKERGRTLLFVCGVFVFHLTCLFSMTSYPSFKLLDTP